MNESDLDIIKSVISSMLDIVESSSYCIGSCTIVVPKFSLPFIPITENLGLSFDLLKMRETVEKDRTNKLFDDLSHRISNGEITCLDWIYLQSEFGLSNAPVANSSLISSRFTDMHLAFTPDVDRKYSSLPCEMVEGVITSSSSSSSSQPHETLHLTTKLNPIKKNKHRDKVMAAELTINSTKPTIEICRESTQSNDTNTYECLSLGVHLRLQPFSFADIVASNYQEYLDENKRERERLGMFLS